MPKELSELPAFGRFPFGRPGPRRLSEKPGASQESIWRQCMEGLVDLPLAQTWPKWHPPILFVQVSLWGQSPVLTGPIPGPAKQVVPLLRSGELTTENRAQLCFLKAYNDFLNHNTNNYNLKRYFNTKNHTILHPFQKKSLQN